MIFSSHSWQQLEWNCCSCLVVSSYDLSRHMKVTIPFTHCQHIDMQTRVRRISLMLDPDLFPTYIQLWNVGVSDGLNTRFLPRKVHARCMQRTMTITSSEIVSKCAKWLLMLRQGWTIGFPTWHCTRSKWRHDRRSYFRNMGLLDRLMSSCHAESEVRSIH